MEKVQKIKLIRHHFQAPFDLFFKVSNGIDITKETNKYTFDTVRTIDLAETSFHVGQDVWPVATAIWGKTIAAKKNVTFELNCKTAVYEVRGTTLHYSIKYLYPESEACVKPANFTLNIPVSIVSLTNWAGTINAPNLWSAAPKMKSDIEDICNWAKDNHYVVRPQGIMHGWSPFSIQDHQSIDKFILIDTTKYLYDMEMLPKVGEEAARVKVDAGATMLELLTFLEYQPNNNNNNIGFSFPHTPAPGHITVGGAIAINGHGTGIRISGKDDFKASYGSMSNNIMELEAVVTDPSKPEEYQIKTFKRGATDTKVFLTQLGGAFIVSVTFRVVDNYNLRCQSIMNIDAKDLFAQPGTNGALAPHNFAKYLEDSGRVEAIWFPFTDTPWLKVWTVVTEEPVHSRKVNAPYNYEFADNLGENMAAKVKRLYQDFDDFTRELSKTVEKTVKDGLKGKNAFGKDYLNSEDIWGPSKNTLLYVKDTTLRVTANGYAIHTKKENVQKVVADFYEKFKQMLNHYDNKLHFPINGPLEIRVTNLDSADEGATADNRPVISSLSVNKNSSWDVAVWFDLLTLPGTKYSNQFYVEFENWLINYFKDGEGKIVPEWSKGWGYDAQKGPWESKQFFDYTKKLFSFPNRDADDDWCYEACTLIKYDNYNIFTTPLLEKLFKDCICGNPIDIGATIIGINGDSLGLLN